MTTFDVENSVAFVTGANKKNGIGRAIVDALLHAGAKKVYATARDTSQLDELVEGSGGRVVAVGLDVTDSEVVKTLGSKYSDVNLLVNNAGYVKNESILGDVEDMKKEMAVNYFALIEIVKRDAARLFARGKRRQEV
ncbi:MAG: SDR family NAD(P)-dependent oxidoreductase [Gaiellaceae bacterium]